MSKMTKQIIKEMIILNCSRLTGKAATTVTAEKDDDVMTSNKVLKL